MTNTINTNHKPLNYLWMRLTDYQKETKENKKQHKLSQLYQLDIYHIVFNQSRY